MALPAHLQRYDSLLDLLVDELVREALELAEPTNEKPAASWQTSPRAGDRPCERSSLPATGAT
jgi:hypothetical protein